MFMKSKGNLNICKRKFKYMEIYITPRFSLNPYYEGHVEVVVTVPRY